MTDDEINILIEEKVFGKVPCDKWEYVNFGAGGGAGCQSRCAHVNAEGNEEIVGCYSSNRNLPNPNYMKYLSAAWHVFLHLSPGDIEIHRDHKDRFFIHVGDECYGHDKDICRAICEAALELKGIDINK